MKFDILFTYACFCFLIGYIKAASETEQSNGNTTVPSTVNFNSNDTNPNITSTEASKEITTVKPTTEETLTFSTSNSTEVSIPNSTNSTSVNTGKTTLTTDLSTGENNPTTAPSKAGSGGFNALSFIGGIVFTVGFLAIMYVGFKFYKSRTERNYHTL